MNKKLVEKVQKINPNIADQSNHIANALVIEPDDELALEKRGTIYTVFDVTNTTPLETAIVTRIVSDVLHDAYYQSETASPIQAIEKAVLKLRDSILSLGNEALNFNIATAVLWGNTLYLVQYGSTKIFLMRNGMIKPIEAASEGKFSVASGVVKDNDVIILATNNFSKKYPPDRLMGATGLSVDALDSLEASLIIKFSILKQFSENERIDFGNNEIQSIKEQPTYPSKKRSLPKINVGVFNERLRTKVRSLLFFAGELYSHRRAEARGLPAQNKKIVRVIAVILALLVTIALIRSIFGKKDQTANQEQSQIAEVVQDTNNETAASDTAPKTVNNPEQDAAAKIERSASNVFYDLSLVNNQAQASEIAVSDTKVFVADRSAGKLYVSDRVTPKLEQVEGNFTGITNLEFHNGEITFVDDIGYKALDPETLETTETRTLEIPGVATNYLDFIYSIESEQIVKYSRSGSTEFTAETWTQSNNLSDAVAMGIDISIYILKQVGDKGELLKFTTGTQDNFEIADLPMTLTTVKDMSLTINLENIYILDAGNHALVILDKDGNYLKQYRLENEATWDNLRSVGISTDESTAYVLNGNKVYEIALTN